MEDDTSNTEEQPDKSPAAHLTQYQFKKGPSGNPAGNTLKEYTREMLAAMTDDERRNFSMASTRRRCGKWRRASRNK